jgi:flavin reductase (DIM6/NTAB) family NADH-FMN oxidoreductase RutF
MMNPDLFRDAMAKVTGPVAIVTAIEGGVPYGTTVSSLASLSLDPAMISVALDTSSTILGVIRRTGRFGVNVLAAEQSSVARRFAGPREERFVDSQWTLSGGVPRLPGTSAWLCGTLAREVPAGDHVLVLGAVVECAAGDASSLSYGQRAFGTHTPHR